MNTKSNLDWQMLNTQTNSDLVIKKYHDTILTKAGQKIKISRKDIKEKNLMNKLLLIFLTIFVTSCGLQATKVSLPAKKAYSISSKKAYIYGNFKLTEHSSPTSLYLRLTEVKTDKSILIRLLHENEASIYITDEGDLNDDIDYGIYISSIKPGTYKIDKLVHMLGGATMFGEMDYIKFIKFDEEDKIRHFTAEKGDAIYLGDYDAKALQSKRGEIKVPIFSPYYDVIGYTYYKAELNSLKDNFTDTTEELKKRYRIKKGLKFKHIFN